MITNDFSKIYGELEKFAKRHGDRSRTAGYRILDSLYEGYDLDEKTKKDIISFQTKTRKKGHEEMLEFWKRAKEVRKKKSTNR